MKTRIEVKCPTCEWYEYADWNKKGDYCQCYPPCPIQKLMDSQKAEILDEVIEKVKGLVKITPPEFQEAGRFERKDWEDIGYNSSLSDVLELLRRSNHG